MPITRVLLLRHAETSQPGVFHGAESDVGLSERGRLLTLRTADHLKTFAPDVVISSAMRRAIDTARPIADACMRQLQIEPQLHERRVGILSGTPTSDTDGPWPDTVRRWMAGDTSYSTPGAESFDDLRDRLVPVWDRLTETHAGQTLVIVAHGIVCRVLLLSLLPGWDPSRWKELGPIRNLAIHELVREKDGIPWRAERLSEMPPGVESAPWPG